MSAHDDAGPWLFTKLIMRTVLWILCGCASAFWLLEFDGGFGYWGDWPAASLRNQVTPFVVRPEP